MLLNSFFTGSAYILEELASALIVVVVASVVAKMSATAITRIGKEAGIQRNIISPINKAVTYFIGFIGLVLVLDIFGFQIATFVASFGIVTLVIGIGAQAIISNFISGLLVMVEKPFVTGDLIDITGFQGTVEDVSLRSTRIKTLDGRVITVPNSTFTSNAVVNYSRTGEVQVRIPVSFMHDVDLGKVSQIMQSVAKETHGVQPYNIEVLVTGITQDAPSWNVAVELRFWVSQILKRDTVASEVTRRLKEELEKEKILAVPQQDS